MSDLVVKDADEAYALGLWCADSYWWSSSIGISNVEPELVIRFARYLEGILGPDRLRIRIYEVPGDFPDERILGLTERISIRPPSKKTKRTAYHAYVNSRALVRQFFAARERLKEIPPHLIGPYLAGRFDGDGNLGNTPRIAYTTQREAEIDAELLAAAGVRHTSVLHYRSVNEFCVYIYRSNYEIFKQLISHHSWKVAHPVETAMASLPDSGPNLWAVQDAGPG